MEPGKNQCKFIFFYLNYYFSNFSTPIEDKPIPIYDECTRSISTTPSSDHSIPIS